MRLIKICALMVTAVSAFMVLGASSAMAVTSLEKVVLCRVKEEPCSAANLLGEGGKIHADLKSGTNAELLSSLGSVICTTSSSESKVSGGNLAHGLVEKLGTKKLFENCTRNGVECEVIEFHIPYLWLALLTSDHIHYHVVLTKHGTGGHPEAHIDCGIFIDCTFGSTELLFEYIEGTSDNVLKVNQTLNLESGFLCPGSSTWHAEYLTKCLTVGGGETACWLRMETGEL